MKEWGHVAQLQKFPSKSNHIQGMENLNITQSWDKLHHKHTTNDWTSEM